MTAPKHITPHVYFPAEFIGMPSLFFHITLPE
jgi:hypothetical protein